MELRGRNGWNPVTLRKNKNLPGNVKYLQVFLLLCSSSRKGDNLRKIYSLINHKYKLSGVASHHLLRICEAAKNHRSAASDAGGDSDT